MRKIILLCFSIMFLQLPLYAYENYIGEDLIKKIDSAYIKANPRQMEKLWRQFCQINRTDCIEKQNHFNEALYNAKLRRQSIAQERWRSITAGAVAGATAASSYEPYQQSMCTYTFNSNGLVCPGSYNPPSYKIYNQYGQNTGKIVPY